MDHGTTGISFAIMDDNEVLDVFKISREDSKAGKVSAIEELSKRVDLDDIELMIITYAMGDGISTILPMERVENRGILSIGGAGKVTGGGTSVYSEIENSNLPVLMIPGIHKNCEWLDPLFRAAYSHHASPEKISIVYNAYLETNWENMIVADISSNSVDLLVEDGINSARSAPSWARRHHSPTDATRRSYRRRSALTSVHCPRGYPPATLRKAPASPMPREASARMRG